MMNLSVASRSPIDVSRQACHTAMEDLAKLLQDTKTSVECIISSYDSSCPATQVSEVGTSLSISLNKVGCLASGFRSQNVSSGNKTVHDPHAVQDWFTRAQMHLEQGGSGLIAPAPDSNTISKADDNANHHDLKVFLEEIKKTVIDWSERHKVFCLQQKPSIGDATHSGDILALGGRGSRLKEGLNQALHADGKQVKVSGSSTCRRKGTTNPSLDVDRVVDGVASQQPSSDGKKPSSNHLDQQILPSDGPRSEEEAAQIPCSAAIEIAQAPIPVNSKIGRIPLQSVSQVPPEAKVVNHLDSKETTAIVEGSVTPRKVDGASASLPLTIWESSPAITKSALTPSHRCPVEVVSSPDWLPEGWITELKTRTSGNSAGTKDKYFCDPVSKRRFRSKKEVFDFLEHGKPKPKGSCEGGSVKKLELLPFSTKKSNKKAKVVESSEASVPVLPPATGPTIPPQGAAALAPAMGPTIPPQGAAAPPPATGPTIPPQGAAALPPATGPTIPPQVAPALPPAMGPTIPQQGAPALPPAMGPTIRPQGAPALPPAMGPTIRPQGAPALASAMGPTIPLPGEILGNKFMPPFRHGQPSEWLAYESLATLQFPMFESLSHTDYGAGKLSGSKGPHIPTRPWYFSGPDTSHTPLVDRTVLGKPADKGRDYQGIYPLPLFNPELAPKSSASKNPIKRKPVGAP